MHTAQLFYAPPAAARTKQLLTPGQNFDILPKHNKAGTVPPSSPQAMGKEVNIGSGGRPLGVLMGVWNAGTDSVAAFFASSEILKWRCFRISNKGHQLNEEIRDKEVRLVGEEGEQLGILSAREALEKATEQGLDLVKISPTAVPPVCKLMDYGKFKFEQQKRDKEARKNQHVVEIKEVRMSPGIDVNDFNVKLRNAQKFLSDGDKVKATVRFRGREMAHTDIGRGLLLKFAEQCEEVATLEKDPKLDGRHMSIFLSPKISKEAKKAAPPAGAE